MKTLIRDGRIVTAVDYHTADNVIDEETISMIGKVINIATDKVVDK